LLQEKIEHRSLFKDVLNISSNQSLRIINKFMRSLYDKTTNQKRKKRQLNFPYSSLSLSDNIANQYNHSYYYFEYNSSIENLIHVELIFPVKRLTNLSTIHLKSNQFNLLLKQPFQINKSWLTINLTQHIKSFPVTFCIVFNKISFQSSAFLTLYFRRSLPLHSIHRRDLLSLDDDNKLITYPNDPSYSQVRPLHTSFAELNWTSWVIEPPSYEMNICSGICHTSSNMPSYLIMQNLLNKIYPKKIPILCCKPKRFSPTILLYYDGPNLILKRHDNMRVVECGCS
jgi:hypothetical protein